MAESETLIGLTIEVHRELDKIWGRARLGLMLTMGYYRDSPLSTEDMAEATGWSTETVRRYIRPLWNINRVEAIREGRNVRYRATEKWALTTTQAIERAVAQAGYVEPPVR